MVDQVSFRHANEIFQGLTSKQVDEGFAYRGHGSSKYKLIPSFQRPGGRDKFLSIEPGALITASSWPFRMFYRTANQMGLSLPSVSYDKHRNYTSESAIDALFDFTDEAETDYDEHDLEIMAFAQHYQVPTPLLDWSRSPLVAMYFAASSTLKHVVDMALKHRTIDQIADGKFSENDCENLRKEAEGKYLSVWQANALALNELSRQRHLMNLDVEGTHSVRFFTPRTQGNQNIVAQQGFFSIHHPYKMIFEYRYAEAIPKCLSEVVQEHTKWLDGREGQSQFLRQARVNGLLKEYVLPYSETVKLLKLLGACGIHAASIYPDHQGCARRVQEQAAISWLDRLL